MSWAHAALARAREVGSRRGRPTTELIEEGHFLPATVGSDPAHPLKELIGDLLVRVPSASGSRCERRTFPIQTECIGGVLHHHLQNHSAVYP